MRDVALIVGAGPGLGAALARKFANADYEVAIASRQKGDLVGLSSAAASAHFVCDVSDSQSVRNMFEKLDVEIGKPSLVVYNAGAYMRGPITELNLDHVQASFSVNALGALAVAQEAAKRMISMGGGTMLFTGASAGLKGFAGSAPFAMGKFALRGLCQSLSRELAPRNIHVAHVVLDGLIHNANRGGAYSELGSTLHPDEIAQTYLELSRQHNSAWTYEVELRPFVETF